MFTLLTMVFIGSLTAIVALLRQVELSQPGFSGILNFFGNAESEEAFETLLHLPAVLSTSMFFLNAAFVSFVARGRGAPLAHIFGTFALIAAFGQLGLEVLTHVAPNTVFSAHSENGILSDTYIRSLAFSITILGAAAMICSDTIYKVGAIAIAIMTVFSFIVYTYLFLSVQIFAAEVFLVVPCIALLALYFILMIDEDKQDLPHMTIGVALLVLSSFGVEVVGSITLSTEPSSTLFTVEARHLIQNSLLIMTFFGALIAYLRPSLSMMHQWIHASLLGIGLFMIYIPSMLLAQSGGRLEQIDETLGYAPMNSLTEAGVVIVGVGVLSGVYLVFKRTKLQPLSD